MARNNDTSAASPQLLHLHLDLTLQLLQQQLHPQHQHEPLKSKILFPIRTKDGIDSSLYIGDRSLVSHDRDLKSLLATM